MTAWALLVVTESALSLGIARVQAGANSRAHGFLNSTVGGRCRSPGATN